MNKLLKEPLTHFLALGALIFVLYGWMDRNQPSADEIVVSRGQQEHLINVFARTWQRPPTEQEFNGLVQDYIREEIAYRQGVAMGFDEGDTIIRRRMRQKLELLTDEIISVAEPSEAELQEFLEQNPERFQVEASFDLRHIYVSRDHRGEAADEDARTLLGRLNSEPDADWTTLGDRLTLGDEFRDVRPSDLERQFGARFAEEVLKVEPGRWVGPVESGYGLHLVFVDNFVPARHPALDEVRRQVETEWLAERRAAATDELYQRLAEQYSIEIEPLSEVADS